MALPFMKFYISNWRSDPGVRRCSAGARGFWIECLFLMFESSSRGYLLLDGEAPTIQDVALQVAMKPGEVRRYRDELLRKGVASETMDGVLFSRKMVRDAARSEINKLNRVGRGKSKHDPSQDSWHETSDGKTQDASKDPPRASRDRACDRDPEARSQKPEARDPREPPGGLEIWRTLWEAKYADPLHVSPRAAHGLAQHEATLGLEELERRIRACLAENGWWAKEKHPLAAFVSQINRFAPTPARDGDEAFAAYDDGIDWGEGDAS